MNALRTRRPLHMLHSRMKTWCDEESSIVGRWLGSASGTHCCSSCRRSQMARPAQSTGLPIGRIHHRRQSKGKSRTPDPPTFAIVSLGTRDVLHAECPHSYAPDTSSDGTEAYGVDAIHKRKRSLTLAHIPTTSSLSHSRVAVRYSRVCISY